MSGDELPEPYEGMTPEEKGTLLLRYARARKPVAWKKEPPPKSILQDPWYRLDFSSAHLEGTDLSGAHLERANLQGANFKGALLNLAHLEGANLINAHLEKAQLINAHLEEAHLIGAHLERAYLNIAHLEGAFLGLAHLEGAHLSGTIGTPEDRRGAHISAKTYTRSKWDVVTLLEWRRAGAVLVDFENLPEEVQEDLKRDKEGLTLYFSRPLSRVDRFIVDGIIVGAQGLLGRETDCEVVEYVSQEEVSYIRLRASNQEDLLVLAKILHEDLQCTQSQGSTAPVILTHALSPNIISQVDDVAKALLKERTELWVKKDDGNVEQVPQADLMVLLKETLTTQRLLTESIKEGRMSGINLTDSIIETGAVVGDGAQGHHSQRAGRDLIIGSPTRPVDTNKLTAELRAIRATLKDLRPSEEMEAKVDQLIALVTTARDQAKAGQTTEAAQTLQPVVKQRPLLDAFQTILLGAAGSGSWEMAQAKFPELYALLPVLLERAMAAEQVVSTLPPG